MKGCRPDIDETLSAGCMSKWGKGRRLVIRAPSRVALTLSASSERGRGRRLVRAYLLRAAAKEEGEFLIARGRRKAEKDAYGV